MKTIIKFILLAILCHSGFSQQTNTYTGYGTLRSARAGLISGYNSAFGYFSLSDPWYPESVYNSAFGAYSLYHNTSGSFNSAFGYGALNSNTIGNLNSAFGDSALYNNTNGGENIAIGSGSMFTNNASFDPFSLPLHFTYGEKNTAIGYWSLRYNLSGQRNTAIGNISGQGITRGNNNTTVGYDAQVPDGTESNQVRIGNTESTTYCVQAPWTCGSDKRWKQDILSSNLGLNFILKLHPVSYSRINDYKHKTEYGFIAQEVEDVLKEFKIGNSGMILIDDKGFYGMRYNDLLAPMVKAIQELKKENDNLRNEIESLKKQNNKLAELESLYKQLNEKVSKLDDRDVKVSSTLNER